MNSMGPMGGGVQNQPAPPYRQSAGKPGTVGVGTTNVSLQQNQQFQQVCKLRHRQHTIFKDFCELLLLIIFTYIATSD